MTYVAQLFTLFYLVLAPVVGRVQYSPFTTSSSLVLLFHICGTILLIYSITILIKNILYFMKNDSD